MGITVKELSTKFHNITESEIRQLIGKSEFKDNDIIPLNNFATCKNMAFKNYAASKEGLSFLELLKEQERINVAKNAGLTILPGNAHINPFTNTSPQYMNATVIPMGQSLFAMNK